MTNIMTTDLVDMLSISSWGGVVVARGPDKKYIPGGTERKGLAFKCRPLPSTHTSVPPPAQHSSVVGRSGGSRLANRLSDSYYNLLIACLITEQSARLVTTSAWVVRVFWEPFCLFVGFCRLFYSWKPSFQLSYNKYFWFVSYLQFNRDVLIESINFVRFSFGWTSIS